MQGKTGFLNQCRLRKPFFLLASLPATGMQAATPKERSQKGCKRNWFLKAENLWK